EKELKLCLICSCGRRSFHLCAALLVSRVWSQRASDQSEASHKIDCNKDPPSDSDASALKNASPPMLSASVRPCVVNRAIYARVRSASPFFANRAAFLCSFRFSFRLRRYFSKGVSDWIVCDQRDDRQHCPGTDKSLPTSFSFFLSSSSLATSLSPGANVIS